MGFTRTRTFYREECVMPNRVCEQMVKVVADNMVFRVWVTADQDFNVDTRPVKFLLNTFKLSQATHENMRSILCEIEKLDNIAAAEVLDNNGNGMLLYPDWN